MSPYKVVLGVSGSVAAYRAADLARELMRRGCIVRVCLTDAAQKFVSSALFEALTGQPTLSGVFDEPERGKMAHIEWARQADLILVAPATANTIAKIASGEGDDMLTTMVIAHQGPLLVAPAMNPTMYANEAFQANLGRIREKGAEVIEPLVGDVACGENGQGKFPTIERIADEVEVLLRRGKTFAGKTILITSGPTQEPIDAVRYLTNRSSGKMGAALARAASHMGAKVIVVSGPTNIVYPLSVEVLRVRTAQDMLSVAYSQAEQADYIFGVAAVADYRPEAQSTGKIRRSNEPIDLRLLPNPDVIAALAKAAKREAKVIGFAAEPTSDPQVALEKIERKGLHGIAMNAILDKDRGFESDMNQLRYLDKSGKDEWSPHASKLACGFWLLEQLAQS